MNTLIIALALVLSTIGDFFLRIRGALYRLLGKPVKRTYGVRKDPEDSRDKICAIQVPSSLPAKYSLRGQMPPIVDQGNLGSCTANSIAVGIFGFLWGKEGHTFTPFSRLFLYYLERAMEGTVYEDSGAYPRDGMKALCKTGICIESLWPYVISRYTKKPSDTAYANAAHNKLLSYERVGSLDQLKAVIAAGFTVTIGFTVYASFENADVSKTGFVPMPEKTEKCLGGHEITICGYNDETGLVEFSNSYGTSWGDKGYGTMAYDTFTKLVSDMWTARKLAIA